MTKEFGIMIDGRLKCPKCQKYSCEIMEKRDNKMVASHFRCIYCLEHYAVHNSKIKINYSYEGKIIE